MTIDHKAGSTTILKQLGGNRFFVMTGAKNASFNSRLPNINVSFSVPASLTKGRANQVTIVLEGTDLYTMKIEKVINPTMRNGFEGRVDVISEATGLYADMLESAFTEHTGLNTHL